MSRTHTHTVALLEISKDAFDEIRTLLHGLGPDYDHMFMDTETIDMTGVGIVRFGHLRATTGEKQSVEDVNAAVETIVSGFTSTDNPALRNMGLLEPMPKNANDRQVGGSHYGLGSMQHWDVVVMFDLDYFQGQITKYVFRWNKKNGLIDLEKAQHFLEKYIEEIKEGRIDDPKATELAP